MPSPPIVRLNCRYYAEMVAQYLPAVPLSPRLRPSAAHLRHLGDFESLLTRFLFATAHGSSCEVDLCDSECDPTRVPLVGKLRAVTEIVCGRGDLTRDGFTEPELRQIVQEVARVGDAGSSTPVYPARAQEVEQLCTNAPANLIARGPGESWMRDLPQPHRRSYCDFLEMGRAAFPPDSTRPNPRSLDMARDRRGGRMRSYGRAHTAFPDVLCLFVEVRETLRGFLSAPSVLQAISPALRHRPHRLPTGLPRAAGAPAAARRPVGPRGPALGHAAAA